MIALEDLLKSHGWTPIKRKRYHQTYVYAAKRQGKEVTEVYIAPESRLAQCEETDVLAKLSRK